MLGKITDSCSFLLWAGEGTDYLLGPQILGERGEVTRQYTCFEEEIRGEQFGLYEIAEALEPGLYHIRADFTYDSYMTWDGLEHDMDMEWHVLEKLEPYWHDRLPDYIRAWLEIHKIRIPEGREKTWLSCHKEGEWIW